MRFFAVLFVLLHLKSSSGFYFGGLFDFTGFFKDEDDFGGYSSSYTNNLDGESFYFNVSQFSNPYEIDFKKTVSMKNRIEMRIIDGEDAEETQFPYQASLFIKGSFRNTFCGGSLISKKYVVSAAHCFKDESSRVTVVLGTENLDNPGKYEKRIDAKRVVKHSRFDSYSLKNDIALLELEKPVTFNDAIQPISLSNGGSYVDEEGTVSGHGSTYDGGRIVSNLMYTQVRVITAEKCRVHIRNKPVTSGHICTKGRDTESACHGDSGGPFVISNELVGIVSFGRTKCTKGYPNVYTRVSEYTDWISHNSDA